MESIGTLAGGIAHDFNNILSALIGYTELAMNDVLEPEKAKSELMEVLKAGDRAKDLVSQILTFSHQTEKKHSPLALQAVIKESLKMLRSIIPSTIELRQDLMDSGLVMSDPTQINQVMMNLCINAAHAMDKTGGILEVGLKRIHLNGNTDIRDLNLVPGPYLRISVSDTGHGMTPEVMARIFDPYFTTKEVGRGTGLGLAVVHGIVKGHGGTITCKSALDEGTTFYVYLPEIESGKEISIHQERTPLPTGTERILYVDDEPVIVDLAKKMLENLGYTVFTRTSSIEALEFFRNNPDKFDLVITDMTMPGMTGDRLTQRMMEIRHDIPIILCTGYSEHITEERAKRIGIREFIMKPLIMKEIAKIIRRALDER
jgi:CheY-like chemotaxis protein